MKDNIFHIGYHKTGTTWFQKNFYPHVENIHFVNNALLQKYFLIDHPNLFDAQECHQAFESSKISVFCDEELSGNIHSGGLHGCMTKEVSYRIKEAFPNAKIVIFIRNQVSMVASIYAQYIKKGGTYGIDKYLYHDDNFDHRFPLFEFEHLNYYELIKHYIELFGRKNVKVFLYEDFLEDNYSFIKSFTEDLSLTYDISKLKKDKTNASYKRITLHIARILNIFTKYDVGYKYRLIHIPGFYKLSLKILDKINTILTFDRKYTTQELLGVKNIEYIEKYYKFSNTKLMEEFDINISTHKYPLEEKNDK